MIRVIDNFLADPEKARASALASGFGTWAPHKGLMGAPFYEGVNFMGDHATLFRALYNNVGQCIPSTMFFRITNPSMERAAVHSDREYGNSHTAIVYLSPTREGAGTGFYEHRETGWRTMPPIAELMTDKVFFERICAETLEGSDEHWQQYEFAAAVFNRCLIFDAPLIHCRLPKNGYGETDTDSRMVWVAHFDMA